MSEDPWAVYYAEHGRERAEDHAILRRNNLTPVDTKPFCDHCENEGMVADPACPFDPIRMRCLRPCPECNDDPDWPRCEHQR